ncbi:MAG: carbohydrate kinase family protein [Patescibacteria group bacterium]|nr:carbohydrate kinase family protein [Patescibacteria group bacterium]
MPQRFDVVTVGSVIRDVTMYTNQGIVFRTPENITTQRVIGFEYGAKVRVPQAHFGAGGGAGNSAVTFRKLGLRVATISRIGNDAEGAFLRGALAQYGTDITQLQVDRIMHTAMSTIVASSRGEHDHVVFVYRGATAGLRIDSANLRALPTRWYYVTAMCGNFWQHNLRQIFSASVRSGAKVAWNPGGEQISAGRRGLDKFLRQTDVLQLNKDEAIELALSGIKLGKRNPSFLNKPLYLLNILSDWGPKCVVITDGVHGAYALYNGKVFHQKALRRKEVDTTGVGDAFGSAFIAGLHVSKGSVAEALRWGVVNSANVLTEVGAQHGILTRAELMSQLKRVK